MNFTLLVVLVSSLIVSTYLCLVMPRKWSRARVVVFSLLLNTVMLGPTALILYKIDVYTFHKDVQGLFQSLGMALLLFFIPIVSWINMIALQLRDYWMKRADISR